MQQELEKVFLKSVGTQLRRLREKHDLSQAQVAFELGTSTRQYQRIEYGEINTGILTFKKLSKIYNVPISEIVDDYTKITTTGS